MPRPNLFIVYVTDVQASARFYGELFDMTPKLATPRFVAYEVAAGVEMALWAGRPEALADSPPRTSEVCLNVTGGPSEIESYYERWRGQGVTVVQEPHDDVFGRTFVIADPDGNLIRVAPVDP